MRDPIHDYWPIFDSHDLAAFTALLASNPTVLQRIDADGPKSLVHAIEEWPAAIPVLLHYGADSMADGASYCHQPPFHHAVGWHSWRWNTALERFEDVFVPPATIRLLLTYGADPNQRECEGRTALEYALWRDEPECAALIRDAGGIAGENEKHTPVS